MAVTDDKDDAITYMSFFFVDIVGLSDPLMSTSTQVNKIRVLNRLISLCPAFSSTPAEEVIVLPTGDGMAIGFKKDFEKPILLAKELHGRLNDYNKDRRELEKIGIRIGCNDGHVFTVRDISGNLNVWGPGIILARRVMDLGDAGHILITSSMAQSLREISDEYKATVHLIEDFQIKHGQNLLIYSTYGRGFGNPAHPTKGLTRPATGSNKVADMAKHSMEGIQYSRIEAQYVLKEPESRIVTHKRICHVRNDTPEPVFVLNEVLMDAEKYPSDINLHIFDGQENEINISGLFFDGLRKVFTIKLERPVLAGQSYGVYSLVYETQEQEKFLVDMFTSCQQLNVSLMFPLDMPADPKLIRIRNLERDNIERDIIVKSSGRFVIRWKKIRQFDQQDTIRLEWQ